MIITIMFRQVKLNTKYYENCEMVLMKYLKEACALTAFSDQVIIIIIMNMIIIVMIFVVIIIPIVVAIAIMILFQEILNALGLFEMFGVGLQNGQDCFCYQIMRMITRCFDHHDDDCYRCESNLPHLVEFPAQMLPKHVNIQTDLYPHGHRNHHHCHHHHHHQHQQLHHHHHHHYHGKRYMTFLPDGRLVVRASVQIKKGELVTRSLVEVAFIMMMMMVFLGFLWR